MTTRRAAQPRGMAWTRRLLVTSGVLATGYGIVGVLTDPSIPLWHYARYTVAVLLGHDLLLMPLAIIVGAALARWLSGWAKPVVQGALLVTATLTVVALPLLLGHGRRSDEPSALPRDYHRGYLIILGLVWLATTAVLAARAIRHAHGLGSRELK